MGTVTQRLLKGDRLVNPGYLNHETVADHGDGRRHDGSAPCSFLRYSLRPSPDHTGARSGLTVTATLSQPSTPTPPDSTNARTCRESGGREDRSCLIMRVRPTRCRRRARAGRVMSDGQVVTTGPALRGACISEER